MWHLFLKRVFDFFVSLFLLIFFSPLMVLVSILLSLVNKGSPFFLHPRPGKNEKIFKVIKFKTMNDAKDPDGKLLPDKLRLTKAGRIIRKMSIDELPQLINILKGEMSIIGPRPLLVIYLQYYNEFERRRHKVRPGITGLSQVSGRNVILWTKRIELDVYYAEHVSFKLDMIIMFKTIVNVLKREGITADVGELGRVPLHIRRNPQFAGLYDENGFPISKTQNENNKTDNN